MDNFKTIYKILKILEKSMNVEEFDNEQLSAEALNIDMNSTYPQVKLIRPEITIKDLEYLNENSLMKKAADAAKGIIDIIK